MAKVSSKNALVMLDDANGVARNISAACRSYEIQYQRNTLPVTAFGDAHEVMALGRGAYAIGLDVLYDNTATTGTYDVINGAVSDGVARTLSVYPQGLGGPVYSGEFVCQGPSYNGASSGMPVSLGSLKFFPASSTAPAWAWKYRDALAYWPLVDTLDYSGNGNTLTNSNATFGNTGIGNGLTAVSFPGTASQLSEAAVAWFPGNTGTFAAWVAYAGTWSDATIRTVASIYAGATSNIQIQKFAAGGMGVTYNLSTSATYTIPSGTMSALNANWFHIAATWASNTLTVYLNSVQQSAPTNTGTWSGNPTITLSATANPWNGRMQDAAIWGTVKSASDILTLATV